MFVVSCKRERGAHLEGLPEGLLDGGEGGGEVPAVVLEEEGIEGRSRLAEQLVHGERSAIEGGGSQRRVMVRVLVKSRWFSP